MCSVAVIYFDAAAQKVRVQVREDGLSIDQIVLSPVQYAAAAPGAAKNDTTILAERNRMTTTSTTPGTVAWMQLINAAANGAELWKSRGCGECADAGATSVESLVDGGVAFSVTSGHHLTVGLGRDTSANTGYAIAYAFSFNASGVFEIREGGVYRCEDRFSASDVFTIAVTAGTVKYYRNGNLVYTSLVPSIGSLVLDTSLRSIGAGVTSATMTK